MEQYETVLQALLQDEADLWFSEFDNDTAYKVGNAIIEKAIRENKSVAVDIRRDGERLFYSRLNGTSSNNDNWIGWKNNVVRHFGHSSYYMHVLLKSTGSTVEASGVSPDEYKAEGGAFPLQLKNEGIIGTITVSGLTGEEDHSMITSVLRELLPVSR